VISSASRKNKVRIVRNYDDSMPTLLGSEGQLSQVFVNLLVNAAQAMNGDGDIEITTRFNNGHSLIQVKDNGPGIAVDKLQTIFEPFFTTKPVGQGTGLGLSISQDIIKRHKGKIDVQSAPGDGCTFVIDLPVVGDQQDARHHAA
jgi:two-component system NtrC family sensor kinase